MRKKTGNKDKAIIEAAIKLIALNGYHKTTVQDIANEADIGVGSVYSYYKCKEEVLDTIFVSLWDDLIANLEQMAVGKKTPSQKIEEHTDKLFDLFFRNENLALVYINEFNIIQHKNYQYIASYTRYYELLSQLFVAGVNSGIFKQGPDFEILKYFIIGGIRNTLIQYYANPGKYTDRAIRTNILSLLEHGFINNV